MKKIFALISLISLTIISSYSYSQNAGQGQIAIQDFRNAKQNLREERNTAVQGINSQIKDTKQEFRNNIQNAETPEAKRELVKQRNDAVRNLKNERAGIKRDFRQDRRDLRQQTR
ncbi:MAG: hypothetical protein SFT90_04270 [Rickettsiales bacterium]|nr:hypothetical protein [Rickettsiales bacterium]